MYVKIYAKACPLCGGDVKGNYTYKYHCESCSILFDYKDLKKPVKQIKIITDNIIVKKRMAQKKRSKNKKL